MFRLLGIEWKKIIYNKGTRIFLLLYFVMMMALVLIIPTIKMTVNDQSLGLETLGFLKPNLIWANITYIMSFGKILLAIIIINSISNEFTYGTYRQNIIDGLSKKQYFLSKWSMSILITLVTTFLVGIMIVLVSHHYNGSTDLFKNAHFLGGLFVEYLTYVAFAMFFTFLFKRSVFAILSLVFFPMVEGILQLGEFLLRKVGDADADFGNLMISKVLPLKINGQITKFPEIDLMGYLTEGTAFKARAIEYSPIVYSLIYFVIFSLASYWLLKKRDVN